MGQAKRTRKFGEVKRILSKKDARRKENAGKADENNDQKPTSTPASSDLIREIPQQPSSMFFQHNEALVPPYNVLVDTNFLSHTISRKIPLLEGLMDLLYAKANPIITDCVMAELEKLGPRYRLALRIARDTRWERLKCDHKGVYADDCIVDRIIKHRIYLVATNDKALKNRIRKIPGVPIISCAKGKYVVEKLPDAPM